MQRDFYRYVSQDANKLTVEQDVARRKAMKASPMRRRKSAAFKRWKTIGASPAILKEPFIQTLLRDLDGETGRATPGEAAGVYQTRGNFFKRPPSFYGIQEEGAEYVVDIRPEFEDKRSEVKRAFMAVETVKQQLNEVFTEKRSVNRPTTAGRPGEQDEEGRSSEQDEQGRPSEQDEQSLESRPIPEFELLPDEHAKSEKKAQVVTGTFGDVCLPSSTTRGVKKTTRGVENFVLSGGFGSPSPLERRSKKPDIKATPGPMPQGDFI